MPAGGLRTQLPQRFVDHADGQARSFACPRALRFERPLRARERINSSIWPWRLMGRHTYPHLRRLLISADAGREQRQSLARVEAAFQHLADELRVPITVCHYPPETSKGNKVEHRLFSFISMSLEGAAADQLRDRGAVHRPNTDSEACPSKRSSTPRGYASGQTVTSRQMDALNLKRHAFHP